MRNAFRAELLKISTLPGLRVGAVAAVVALPLFSLLVVTSGGLGTDDTLTSGAATGTLVGLLGYSFLESSAKAKMANAATNLAALVVFVPQGAVLWRLALVMGGCNIVGGYLGARLAVARGAAFVRVFFLVVVIGFVVRIGGELLGLWG